PEYLHIIFKIKLYLIFLFNNKDFEKELALFYSHFDIIKVYKNIIIRAYLYHGFIETKIAEFFSESFKDIKNDRLICDFLSERRLEYKDIGHIEAFMILLV